MANQTLGTMIAIAKKFGSSIQNGSVTKAKLSSELGDYIDDLAENALYIDPADITNPTSVTSNASAIINAAITAAHTNGNHYVIIPKGEYWLTATVYLVSDVILKGCGMDATTLKIADGCDIDAIRVSGPTNNSGIMDLTIDGNRITNYSTFVNGHHGNAINVWLHYGRIERVRTNWVFKHSLLLNYDTGNSDDGLGFEPAHQNDMGNLNKVLWCDFCDSLLQGIMWGWRTMDSWMCYTNIGSHAANLYLEGGTSRFIGNHFDGDGDNGAGPEYNVYCGDGCKAMVFSENIFENTQKENIFFRQPSYSNQTMTITISDNIIRTCSKSQNEQYANIKISGYSAQTPATEIVISGNQILNPDTNANHGYAGIHLLYCDGVKIEGNAFFNVGDDDVIIDDSCENVVSDNKLAEDVLSLKSSITKLTPDATASDVGKAIIVKTVADGKPSSYEYGEAGGGSVDPSAIAQAVDDWCDENITNPDSPPLDRSLTSSSAAAPADVTGYITKRLQRVDIEASANLWNKDDVNVGLLYKNGTVYTGGAYDGFRYNKVKIKVTQGDVISFYRDYDGGIVGCDIQYIACYKGDGTVDSDAGIANVPTRSFTIPANIVGIVVSVSNAVPDFMVIKNAEQAPTEYIPYVEENHYYIATEEFIPSSVIENAVSNKVDKDGENQVTAKNAQFIKYSPNLFDKTELTVGLVNKNNGDVLPSYSDYRTSDWIEVDPSTYYTFSCVRSLSVYTWLCWYKENKVYISGEEASTNPTLTRQSPSNAKYIRFSFKNTVANYDIQLEKGSTATEYMEYDTGRLKSEYAPVGNENFVLNLPAKVYALVGTEMNIYFDNLVEGHDDDYLWDVTCSTSSVGMQLERGYRVVASTAGTYTLTFTAKRKRDGSTVTKSTTLIVVGTNAGSGDSASIIILGDSTTAGGTVVSKIHENFTNDGMSVSTLGTRGTSPNNHEGRSGWTFKYYFTKETDGVVNNPFYNTTSETFDADYYFTNSGVSEPDYFAINLGINDMFGHVDDISLNAKIEETIDYCDSMIESILDATTSTKVCICLTIPPNYSQDAFGREYYTGQNRNRYKHNNLMWVKRLLEEYEGRENEGIYVIPINLSLDTRYNMGFDTQPVNARNTDITYQMPIGNGGVHPVTSGYWQIADVYTAFLKGNAT